MESLQRLQSGGKEADDNASQRARPAKTEFQEFGDLLSPHELDNVHDHGGNLFHPVIEQLNPRDSRLQSLLNNMHSLN